MTQLEESAIIPGVILVHLQQFSDERGRFMETFRKEWFPQRTWQNVQSNRSDSRQGVLRGLHFHHHQVDYWTVERGSIRVGLADLRPDSTSYGESQIIDISEESNLGVFIPVGVAHGYLARTAATLNYIVDNYYDGGADENGVAWNDPQLAVEWGIESPLLSGRDAANPLLRDIPLEKLPSATR